MELIESQQHFRDRMVEELKRELFGPCPLHSEDVKTEVLEDSPLQLYSTGVLFPQKMRQNLLEDNSEAGGETENEEDQDDEPAEVPNVSAGKGGGSNTDDGGAPEAQPLNLANEFSPSAVGISFCIGQPVELQVQINLGIYKQETHSVRHHYAGKQMADGTPYPATKEIRVFVRKAIKEIIPIAIPSQPTVMNPIKIPGTNEKLCIHPTIRLRSNNSIIVSLMAVNENLCANSLGPNVEQTFFQVEFKVSTVDGRPIFLPIDHDTGHTKNDDYEFAKIELLYRHRRSFALGHGCAGDWNRDETLSEKGATNWLKTSAIPSYEISPVRPRENGYGDVPLNLSMHFLAEGAGNADPSNEIIEALTQLADDYEKWIADCRTGANELPTEQKKTASQNLDYCDECLRRIIQGIEVLRNCPEEMLAFRLANRAMLIQQIRSSVLKSRNLGDAFPNISSDYASIDGAPINPVRRWRPFQLAFILMNIAGTADPEHIDHDIVDLIWFPTGGGKTEAYLGLAAFTICLQRLRGPQNAGTTVLMRYTLRLLTAQQFQRASVLILALESLRHDRTYGADLGEKEISIGLWVGQGLSPNKRADARGKLKQMKEKEYAPNPFQVLECPWCRVELNNRDKLGYRDDRDPNSEDRTVRFRCPDNNCRFSDQSVHLPIYVIDEDIYDHPPTLLLGTVDKFAQVAWDDRVGRLFGIGSDNYPPSLIIQDELHLISGPLGTIVGLYEVVIDRLCTRNDRGPKIIASTATVRRASEQCRHLYNRKMFEFPPQGLRAGESYFAYEDKKALGRLYVGVFGSAVRSHQTALVRTCSALLQSPRVPDDERKRIGVDVTDPYGTLVWYFNSLRELGHAATLCTGDIPEYLKSLCRRRDIPPDERRYIRPPIEMTSRRTADEIPKILKQLDIPWRAGKQDTWPVDVLLATNMISVGVDVDRLGLMVMSGQTKGTSEYIQASSRVGRKYPGLVVTVYTQTKSRDRSHYERFVTYHQSIYKHVEPTSVTPFSPQARDRGLAGVLIALARLDGRISSPDNTERLKEVAPRLIELILNREKEIDPGELDDTRYELQKLVDQWIRTAPPEYGWMGGTPETTTLAYPYGSNPHDEFQRDAWPVLTSMRNVDGTSQALVLNQYPVDD